ncbi:MAG: iron ABC transporter permease, partial [SAR324 cluster bacterium]|nr:iron ABC transporter permease [SAR324 cluster bacterium]
MTGGSVAGHGRWRSEQMSQLLERLFPGFLQILAILLLVGGFYLPLILFLGGQDPLQPGVSVLRLDYLLEFLADPWNLRVLGFSLKQAFWSAILSILLGLPGAWLLTRYDFPGRAALQRFAYLPFLLPSILVVLAMVLFFGNQGWVNQTLMFLFQLDEPPVQFLYSLNGILLGHVFYNFPLAMRLIGDQWERISAKYALAARMLGHSPQHNFFRVTLPLILPSVLGAFALIFLLCLNSFAIILVLGGGVRHTTIEVLIYQLARIDLDFSGAAVLSLLQSGLAILTLLLLLKQHRKQRPVRQQSLPRLWLPDQLRLRRLEAWLGVAWLIGALIFGIGPLLAIIFDSLRQADAFTWDAYQVLFADRENNRFFSALWNSLRIGLTSALLASLLGAGLLIWLERAPLRFRAGLEGMILLPMAFSTVVFGVAWFHLNQSWLEGSVSLFWIAAALHAILGCPYWLRLVLPTWRAVPTQW